MKPFWSPYPRPLQGTSLANAFRISRRYFLAGFFLFSCTQNLKAQNPVVTENQLPGTSLFVWDNIWTAGDPSIQGFATEISVNKGQSIQFKVDVNTGSNKDFTMKVYRLGYYQGNGARLVADLGTISGIAQPAPLVDEAIGLVDCGNWSVTTSWNVPADAVSGIYVAKLERLSNGGASHITFVVRDDARNSDILFKTSDATWHAYNNYGGPSLYYGGMTGYPNGRASKVSYNRPFNTRSNSSDNFVFNAEFPMLQWLERNGYDVTYVTDVDFERDASPITPSRFKAILSVGHDEYWSKNQRDRVENARNSGVHLAFFSANEVYWKTRWEPSIDGSNQDYRTLVCYKEGSSINMGENTCGTPECDPLTGVWTGLWRFGQQEDAGKPENELSGQSSWLERRLPLVVPGRFRNMRFWRNTSIASMSAESSISLGTNILGYEWNYDQEKLKQYNPPGRVVMSSTNFTGDGGCCAFQDGGELNYNTVPGRVYNHKLTLYRHQSGALVFAAGTVSWSWGLDRKHDTESSQELPEIQQATVNILAEMGLQPATLQNDLVPAFPSGDFSPPTVVITSPLTGTTVGQGKSITVTGTISEVGGGVNAGVEISVDGGQTWDLATLDQFGTSGANWSYSFVPAELGSFTVIARGFDDLGNLGAAAPAPSPSSISLVGTCPCSVFSPFETQEASLASNAGGRTVGMKFQTSINGYISGARFYKDASNTGLHVAKLYSASGNLLASATFPNETNSGWQQVTFASPVSVTANTTYIISYYSESGEYSYSNEDFSSPVVRGPLRGLAEGEDGSNGLLSSGNVFPSESPFFARNYMVDAIFTTSPSCSLGGTLEPVGPVCAGEPVNLRFTSTTGTGPYTLILNETGINAINSAEGFPATHIVASPPTLVNVSLWPSGSGGIPSLSETATELGVKFRSSLPGIITAVRFYKSEETGTGVFPVRIYDLEAPGTPIAFGSITINTPGVSGWQVALLSSPLSIQANKTYIASYVAPNGGYTETIAGLTLEVVNGPLSALAEQPGAPNGVYKTGTGTEAPDLSDNSATNYWVDVVFTATTQVRLSQITDEWGVTCINNNPGIQTLNLTPANCAFLPVTLTNFSLVSHQSTVQLSWSTSSENNNRGFEVLRSTDGGSWTKLGFVPGAGNSQTTRQYRFTDKNLQPGRYYYRLKQVDLDGRFSLSRVLVANLATPSGYALGQNYPNPANGRTAISFTLPEQTHVQLAVYDLTGRKVRELVNGVREAGTHTVEADLRGLDKAVYFYTLKAGTYREVKRMVVE